MLSNGRSAVELQSNGAERRWNRSRTVVVRTASRTAVQHNRARRARWRNGGSDNINAHTHTHTHTRTHARTRGVYNSAPGWLAPSDDVYRSTVCRAPLRPTDRIRRTHTSVPRRTVLPCDVTGSRDSSAMMTQTVQDAEINLPPQRHVIDDVTRRTFGRRRRDTAYQSLERRFRAELSRRLRRLRVMVEHSRGARPVRECSADGSALMPTIVARPPTGAWKMARPPSARRRCVSYQSVTQTVTV